MHKDIQTNMSKFMEIFLFVLSLSSFTKGFDFSHDNDDKASLPQGSKCKIKTGEQGVCKLLSSCDVYYEALRNKSIQYSFLNICSFIELDEVICCPLDDKPVTVQFLTGDTTQGSTTVSSPNHRFGVDRPAVQACRNYSGAAVGFHILNGFPVAPGEYPHMGGLVYEVNSGYDYRCASSLISPRYALTAAHCVNDPKSLPKFVRFGVVVWNATQDENFDDILPVDVPIENITIHNLYASARKYHDIALIRLNQDVEFTPFVRPACLHTDTRDLESDQPLVVIGWGVTDVQTRTRSSILLQTNVSTVALDRCNAIHKQYGLQRTYPLGLTEGQYCAFDPEYKSDACESDSGGPLQLVEDNKSTIVGVISFGRSCATALPAIYARVAAYLDWIESVVWPS